MSTLHLSVNRVDAQSFIWEARHLLARSPGYLAVALIKGEDVLHWIERSQISDKPEEVDLAQPQPLRHLLELTLISIKHLAQTLPKRYDHDEPMRLSLSYQLPSDEESVHAHRAQAYHTSGPSLTQKIHTVGEGSVHAHECCREGLLLLFTQEGELSERARFWLRHYSSRLFS